MKVIFLDNDGVICLSQQWGSRSKKRKEWNKKNNSNATDAEMPVYCRFDHFDPKAIKVLNQILEATGAEIVVSSDWKLHANLEELREYYSHYKLFKLPIDMTPRLIEENEMLGGLCSWKGWLEKARAEEIRIWLSKHPEVTHWVAVDDLDMSMRPDLRIEDAEWGLEHFVLTPSSHEGIKKSGVKDKIIKILNEHK